VSARKEGAVGCLIFGGLLLIPVGILLTVVLYFGAIVRFEYSKGTDLSLFVLRGLGPFTILLGMVLAGVGLFWGWKEGQGQYRGKGRAQVHPNARVVARFGQDRDGTLLTEEWQYEEAERPRYFVKLQYPDGRIVECETRPEVWAHCGEGMVGDATIDGGWLGMFAAKVGHAPPPNPYG
jgi:hypothetical protein